MHVALASDCDGSLDRRQNVRWRFTRGLSLFYLRAHFGSLVQPPDLGNRLVHSLPQAFKEVLRRIEDLSTPQW